MQNTVYALVCEYAKTTPYFKFHAGGINLIGQFVAREWRQQGGTMDQLDLVDSIEPEGLYKVYEYPQAFVPKINEVIERYVKWCMMPKHLKYPKTISEKPLIKTNPAPPISYSSDTSKKKERKRKPIPATPQREFSGKKLINKK
jgi:hypothetical protein